MRLLRSRYLRRSASIGLLGLTDGRIGMDERRGEPASHAQDPHYAYEPAHELPYRKIFPG